MSRPVKHPKTGVYQFRKAVPDDLRALVGKREEKRSLGTKDPDLAKRRFAEMLLGVEERWANLRVQSETVNLTERQAHALAMPIFKNWLAQHRDNPSAQYLWHREHYLDLWTASEHPETRPEPGVAGSLPLDNVFRRSMRRLCLSEADDVLEHHGLRVNEFDRSKLAKAIASAFQKASNVLAAEAEGVYASDVDLQRSLSPAGQTLAVVHQGSTESRSDARQEGPGSARGTITELLQAWWSEASAAGLKPSTYESYRNTIQNFVRYLRHDEAARITIDDVLRFKDYRLSTPSPRTGRVPSAKTVKDSDLAALKAVFGWAVANRRLAVNPASGITIKLGTPRRVRSKGFTDAEAAAILTAAYGYQSKGESALTVAAKKWVPWLCAFTGARVGEMAQLRKQDVTQHDIGWIIRITPEAGTVKTNVPREVVLHPQVVELGFPEFVHAAGDGHLFLKPAANGDILGPLQGLKNRLAEFGRAIVPDPNVAPNHGWRHRFKTVGMEGGIAPRILDAIQGQAPRSVADTYGDVTLKTVATAIRALPRFQVMPPAARKPRVES